MKPIKLLIVCALLLNGKILYSQNFEAPKNCTLKVAADYALYEKDLIEADKWLKTTSFNEQVEKRKEVSAFVVKWISGSPTVNVEINSNITDFDKNNAGMMVLFMAGCARYVLENNFSKDMREKHKAGLHDMIAVYKQGKGITKDKKMDKLIKSDEKGMLDEWLDENLRMN